MSKVGHFIEESLIALLLFFMVTTVFAEVVARKMGYGIQWAQEATLLANAWLVLIGASYCVREKAHICVDLILTKLPSKYAKIVLLISIGFCIIYCSLFLYGAWFYVAKMRKYSLMMQDIPMERWIAQTCLIFGFGLLILRFLEAAYQVAFKNDMKVLHQVGEVEESMALADSLSSSMKNDNVANTLNSANNQTNQLGRKS